MGYREAGDALVEAAVDRRMHDYLFYPACFVYRHCLELTLKDLIYETERLILLEAEWKPRHDARSLKEVGEELLRTHRLRPLLDKLEVRLATVDDTEMPESVRSVVHQLDAIDPEGQSFRYAVLKNGARSFSGERQYDLAKIKQTLGEAIDYLNYGVGTWIDEQMSTLREMLADADPGY
jgi:hypothetical protein